MSKKIFQASFPGITVTVVEHKRLPNCRPEFRCFYLPGFKRITIRVLPGHIYVNEQILYIDLVKPTDRWNVVVKESDAKQFIISSPGEVITAIKHRFKKVEGIDYERVSIILRSLDGMVRSFFIDLKQDDLRVLIPVLQ